MHYFTWKLELVSDILWMIVSNIWSWIHGKVKQHWGWVEKERHLYKKAYILIFSHSMFPHVSAWNSLSEVVIPKFSSSRPGVQCKNVLKMLENFQENICGGVQYWLNFGMNAWNFTNLVHHYTCVSWSSRFSRQLLCKIPLLMYFIIYESLHNLTWTIRKLSFIFFSTQFSFS